MERPEAATLTPPNADEHVEDRELIHCSARRYSHMGRFFTEVITFLAYNLAITLLGICPNELQSHSQTKIYTWMFIAALLIIAKTWKQPSVLQ